MRVVIMGGRGMLGRDLAPALAARGHDVLVCDLPEADLTQPSTLEAPLRKAEVVVNCAAYTRVDDAETHGELAREVNAVGAGTLARRCAAAGARLVHLSTDYVFDGAKGTPYGEDDPVAPLNVYGMTKWEGEEAVRTAGGAALIVRTQSLFGVHGHNFVRTMLRLFGEPGKPVRVVDDQTMGPTWTGHLAEALVRLAEGAWTGTVHVSAAGACTWCDFARAIAARVKPGQAIEAIPSSAYPAPARRPACSLLDNGRFRAWTGWEMPPWEAGLDGYLAALARAKAAADDVPKGKGEDVG